jgi:hypothetical protein
MGPSFVRRVIVIIGLTDGRIEVAAGIAHFF